MRIDKKFHHNLSWYLAYTIHKEEKKAVNLTTELFDSTRSLVCLFVSDDIKSAFMSVGHNCFVAQVLQKKEEKVTHFV